MPAMMTPAQIERNLKLTGGKTVVKGAVTTYGHVSLTPMQVVDGSGGGAGVQTADAAVVVADGILPGVTNLGDGIDDSITVDGVNYTIIGITPPDREHDGDMLKLVLTKA